MSFAAYASQLLTRPQGASSSSSRDGTQPLFFSFTTDDASVHLDDADDADDPHFRKYDSAHHADQEDDEEDPYLRLDDDDAQGDYSPTIDQHNGDRDDADGVGWLAHQRSPSPPYVFSPQKTPRVISPIPRGYTANPPPDPQSLSLALSESLLPRTGADAHAFNLPPPNSRRRRPQPNAYAAAAFFFTYTLLCVLSLLSLVLHNGGERPPPALLHTVPLVTFLTMLSATLAYTHLAFLRAFLRPVLLVSALAPPLALFLSAVLAFAGSFSSGAGWGLRLFALLPLGLALLSIRRLPAELHRAARSPALLAIATRVLFLRAPLLMLLSPLILLASLLAALPLLTLLVRLPLSHAWPTRLATAFVALAALHLSFLARALQRSTVASALGAWYFGYSIPAPSSASPTGSPILDAQLRILHAALLRPPGPLVLASLTALALSFLRLLRTLLLLTPLALPYRLVALLADSALARVEALGERLGGGAHAGVYCGLTGAGWRPAVRSVRELRADARAPPNTPLPLPRAYTLALPFALIVYLRAAGDREGEEGVSYAEQQRAAVAAAVLAGAVCAGVSVFCAGLVRDCADTLYVCHLIDRVAGRRPGDDEAERERQEVWAAFDPSPNLDSPPLDAEAQAGFGFGANFPFDLGRLNALFGAPGTSPNANANSNTDTTAGAGAERGGRGEEPVYARLRRTSEEANRKVAPSYAASHPQQYQQQQGERGRGTQPRGFRAPETLSGGRGVGSAMGVGGVGGVGAAMGMGMGLDLDGGLDLDADLGRPAPKRSSLAESQAMRYSQQSLGLGSQSRVGPRLGAGAEAKDEDGDGGDEGDADSLNSDEAGGESSGAFPGSGFFA